MHFVWFSMWESHMVGFGEESCGDVSHAKCTAQIWRLWKPCEMGLSHNCSLHGGKSEVCEKNLSQIGICLIIAQNQTPLGSHIWSVFDPMHMKDWAKVKLVKDEIGSNIEQNH